MTERWSRYQELVRDDFPLLYAQEMRIPSMATDGGILGASFVHEATAAGCPVLNRRPTSTVEPLTSSDVLFCGPAGTCSPLHHDFPHGIAVIQVLTGRKRLLVVPAEAEAALESAFPRFADCRSGPIRQTSSACFDLASLDFSTATTLTDLGAASAELGPGDVVLIGSGVFHQLQNVEESTLSRHDMLLLPTHLRGFVTAWPLPRAVRTLNAIREAWTDHTELAQLFEECQAVVDERGKETG